MRQAAAEQRFEDAARERNRLRAVRSLLERQRVGQRGVGTLDAIAVAVHEGEANAQVFQVRDGVLSDRQSFYLDNAADGGIAEVAEAFILQYYASAMMIPPLLVVQREVAPSAPALAEALSERRGGTVEIRAAERGDKRRILELAERNARLALDQEKLRSERRRQQRVEALDGLQQALGLDTLPLRIECFDISTLMGTNTVASMVVFEGGGAEEVRLPAVQGPRRLRGERRTGDREPDDFAAMEEVLVAADGAVGAPAGPLAARQGVRPELRRAPEPDRDRRRQGPAVGRAARAPGLSRPRRGRDLAGQADRGGVHPRARGEPLRPAARHRRSSSCSSGCATRRTGSRSPTTGSAATGR